MPTITSRVPITRPLNAHDHVTRSDHTITQCPRSRHAFRLHDHSMPTVTSRVPITRPLNAHGHITRSDDTTTHCPLSQMRYRGQCYPAARAVVGGRFGLGWARVAMFTSAIWTRLESEVGCRRRSKCVICLLYVRTTPLYSRQQMTYRQDYRKYLSPTILYIRYK